MHFNIAYPFVWFLAGLLLAGGASYVLYKNNPLNFSKPWMNRAIMALRFLLLWVICLLLLQPMIKWLSHQTEKPILVVAIDNSESMVLGKDSAAFRRSFSQQLQQFTEQVSEQFLVKTYTFGSNTNLTSNPNFTEKLSNISAALTDMEAEQYNLNHAATVLISDGIYNRGTDPSNVWPKGKLLHVMGYGDTTIKKDVVLQKVRSNNIVFAGNDFEVWADVKSFLYPGENLDISIRENETLLGNNKLQSTGNAYFGSTRFVVSGAKEGLHTYTLSVKPLAGESNTKNNSIQIQVNVLKAKQKIVLLYQTPHPDIAAIKNSLSSNGSYELLVKNLADYRDEGIQDAALFILHQIPGQRGEGVRLVDRLQKNNMPVMHIVGRQSGLSYLSATGILKINGSAQNANESQGWLNENFSLFQVNKDFQESIQKFSPLYTPYGNYQIPTDAQVLLFQQIGYVKTNNPLLFFCTQKGINYSVLTGEGFWRWRMQDYAFNKNQNFSQELFSRIIQWTAGKSDKSKFRVYPSKKFYDENEPISFEAELFNDVYERINTPEISLTLKNKNKTYPYQFSKTDKAYELPIGSLAPGTYTYEAKVTGRADILPKTGTIYVQALQTEALLTRANFNLLRNLAAEANGNFYTEKDWEKLGQDLLNNNNLKPVIYETEELKELLNQKWIFFLLIGFLSLEWFIRKWNGFI